MGRRINNKVSSFYNNLGIIMRPNLEIEFFEVHFK